MTSSAPSHRRLEFPASDVDLGRFARPGLVVAVVASGLLIYHLNRGSSFSADDWFWISGRRGNSVDTFLAPYNGHLSLVPVAIYRLMFAVFGISSFVPYRLMLLVVASVTALVIFEYARHRIGEFCALLVTTVLLFIGPGWNDIGLKTREPEVAPARMRARRRDLPGRLHRLGEPLASARSRIHRKAEVPQRGPQQVGDVRLINDHEEASVRTHAPQHAPPTVEVAVNALRSG